MVVTIGCVCVSSRVVVLQIVVVTAFVAFVVIFAVGLVVGALVDVAVVVAWKSQFLSTYFI